jgi:hypothetical protein
LNSSSGDSKMALPVKKFDQMTLRIGLVLGTICWLFLIANAWAGCGGPVPTHLPTCRPPKLLWQLNIVSNGELEQKNIESFQSQEDCERRGIDQRYHGKIRDFTCHPVKLYVLKYWSYDPDGYVISTPDLTLAECNEARKRFHVRGAELEREAADKNWKKHPPYCAPM